MTLRTLNYGNCGIFLIMGNAGFCPSTVRLGKAVVELTGDFTPDVASLVVRIYQNLQWEFPKIGDPNIGP